MDTILNSGSTNVMQIRQAEVGDAAAVRACAEDAYTPYIAAIGRKPAPMTADFEAQISNGLVHTAMDDEDCLLGFIVFYRKAGQMFLENVAVYSSAAGQGVGKALIAYCESQARAHGLSSVCLYTNEKMTANLSIYPKLGYLETARRQEDGFNRVFFEKLLG